MECPELEKMEFFVQPNGSLFRLTKGEYNLIMDIIREENPLKQPDAAVQKYTKEDFLSKVYMTEERYDVLEALLRNKKNVILQGAPGVGKTFTAKKLTCDSSISDPGSRSSGFPEICRCAARFVILRRDRNHRRASFLTTILPG